MIHRVSLIAIVVAAAAVGQQPTYVLSGTVVDSETQTPLPRAEVDVSPVAKRNQVESVLTDGGGHFAFNNLFAGKYALSAARSGYLPSGFQEHGAYSTAIAVGPGLQSTGIVFPLKKKASISGVITDQDGEPVPYARVQTLRQTVEDGLGRTISAEQGNTQADGQYRIGGLPPGTYFLVVFARPWYAQQYTAAVGAAGGSSQPENKLDVAYPITFYPGTTSDSAATPIVLSAGSQAQANIAMTAIPSAHVIIKRGNGLNINAHLLIPNRWEVPLEPGFGYFNEQDQFFNIAPGRYELVAGMSDAAGSHLTLKVIDVSGTMTIEPEAIESRRSIVATINPVPTGKGGLGGSLALRNLTTLQVGSFVPGGKGQYHWPGLRGNMSINSIDATTGDRFEIIWNGPGGYYIDGVSAAGAKVTGRIIDLLPDAPVQLQVYLGQGTSVVNGRVDHDGKPTADAMVLLLRNDFATAPSLIRRDQSDSDGTFTLSSVVPGSYTLLAIPADDNLEYANPEVIGPYLAKGKRLSIAANGRYDETVQLTGTTQ